MRALGYARVDHLADGFKLHRRDNRADVDRLVKRMTDAQRFHAGAEAGIEGFSDAFLHQQARTRAAYLALVEPDGVNQALDRGVEIGIVEDDEGRFAAQFERELLVAIARWPCG